MHGEKRRARRIFEHIEFAKEGPYRVSLDAILTRVESRQKAEGGGKVQMPSSMRDQRTPEFLLGELEEPSSLEETSWTPPITPDRWEYALSRLHDGDRDILEARARGLTQREIGTLLDLTQAAVSHRMRKIQERLAWLLVEAGSWFAADELREALTPHWAPFGATCREWRYLECLCTVWYTTKISDATEKLGYRVGIVYTAMDRLHTLAETHPELEKFSQGFLVLRGGLPGAPGRSRYERTARWCVLSYQPHPATQKALRGRKGLHTGNRGRHGTYVRTKVW